MIYMDLFSFSTLLIGRFFLIILNILIRDFIIVKSQIN